MRYPDFLNKNDRIGFIAPSFGCTIEPYESLFKDALLRFNEEGFKTVLGPNCFMDKGIGKSNTPLECAKEINDFFINDRSDVIISCGGGETMCEDLPFVDFKAIREAKPKWYMGYSDNTNLTFLLNILCDTASIYGPNAASFGELPRLQYVKDAFKLLKGELLEVSNYDEWYLGVSEDEVEGEDEIAVQNGKYYKVMPYKQRIFTGEKETYEVDFSGRIIGGCLDCLVTLAGTKFDKVSDFTKKYEDDGIIWFIEACELNVMSIRRALWQLEQSGWFENVRGFVVGRPRLYYDEFDGIDHIEAVRGILSKYNVPIVMDTDIGHLSPAMPIISGSMANITALDNKIEIKYELR